MTRGDRPEAPRPSLEPPVRPRPTYGRPHQHADPLPTRVIAATAGMATALGFVVLLAPSVTPAFSGTTTDSASSGTDEPAASPFAAADVVETAAPSPVKVATAGTATAGPATGGAATGGAATAKPRADAKPKASRQPAVTASRATPKPTPRPAPKATPKPRPKPTPVPTAASGKP